MQVTNRIRKETDQANVGKSFKEHKLEWTVYIQKQVNSQQVN